MYINPANRDDRLTCVFVVPTRLLKGGIGAYKARYGGTMENVLDRDE